ncbi:MAG: RNA polymerase sigma factor [Bacteroidetes bacterium]|nr:MAG: RNA polymerase sigma factor [Bacteroidota bacterium]
MAETLKNTAPTCTDKDVLLWLSEGTVESENKAITCLYRRLLEKLRPWIFGKGGSDDDLHDALTDALTSFICIFREKKYREEGKLEHYVYRIAQYKYYDACRKRGRDPSRQSIEALFPNGVPTEISEDPQEVAEQRTETEAYQSKLEHCLDQIGERCKERLIRFWYLEQSHEEIAAAMGDSSVDSAKVMKGKCQRKLEACANSTPK